MNSSLIISVFPHASLPTHIHKGTVTFRTADKYMEVIYSFLTYLEMLEMLCLDPYYVYN